jgi:acyl-CoA thioesterase
METAFARDTAVRREEGCRFVGEVSAEWRAGRGPHGGYLAAMILRSLVATVNDDERAPRSLTVHFARAPEPGPVTLHTVVERAGRSLTTVSARMEQDGALMALALAAFSVPWTAPEFGQLPMPPTASPDPRPSEPNPVGEGVPRFVQHMVMQPRLGPLPFSHSDAPMEIGGWLGLYEPEPLDAAAMALFADAWPSPPFVRLEHPAFSPTIDLTIHFRQVFPRTDAEPSELCLARFRTGLVHEGFFENDAVIWAADGTVLTQARQLALLLPAG